MTSVTTTTLANWVDEMWSPELNTAVEYFLVIAKLFKDRSSELPHGNILHEPASHNLTANDKAAGTDATPEAITEPDQTFTVSTHKIVAQQIESIAQIQSRYDARANFNKRAAYALARAMESSGAALFDDNTTQSVGTLGSEATEDNILAARAFLVNSAAQPPYNGVIAPATYNGFLKIDRFSNSSDYGAGEDAITMAHLGAIYNMRFYESQLTVGSSPNSSGAVWADGHFFKIVQKPPKFDVHYSPFAKAWEVAADCIYGMFELLEADEAAAATSTARLHGVRIQAKK